MGASRPKRTLETIAEMEEAVSDAILTQDISDPVLAVLIRIATVSIKDNRPVFPNPMHEPVLWTMFIKWVSDGYVAASKVKQIMEEAAKIPER